jgi:hypothetical protein
MNTQQKTTDPKAALAALEQAWAYYDGQAEKPQAPIAQDETYFEYVKAA